MDELFQLSLPMELRTSINTHSYQTYDIPGIEQCVGKDGLRMERRLERRQTLVKFDLGRNDIIESLLKEPVPKRQQLINILRITIDCPFVEIRQLASFLMERLKEKGVPLPYIISDVPSYFIPPSEYLMTDVTTPKSPTSDDDNGESTYVRDALSQEITKPMIGRSDSSDSPKKHKVGRLLSETFLSTGRINHAIQIMAYHSDYLEVFLRAHHFLLRGDGPLPYTFRHYIAIMAAARFQCSYLMELQKREFLLQGGDPKWLQGLEAAPKKLTSLYHINKMMAHRPWFIKKEDFLFLTKKAGWSLSEVVQAVVLLAHFHSLSSFIHGCGITPEIDFDKGHSYLDPVTFNVIGSSGTTSPTSTTLASPSLDGQIIGGLSGNGLENSSSPIPSPALGAAVGGSGVSASGNGGEGSGNKAINKTDMASNSPVCGSPITNHYMHQHHLTTNKSPNPGLLRSATHHMNSQSSPTTGTGIGISSPPSSLAAFASSPPKKGTSEVEILMATMKNLSETIPIEDPEERKKRFETVAACDDSHEKENRLNASSNIPNSLPPDVSPFLSDPEFTYEDFAKRGQISELHTFRIQDYSWEEHGFSLVNRLYADVGGYLDDKFKVAQNMTYYTMGDRAYVDTTKFRTAVWNYIQCLYGIRHDDYDYGEVNQLLERPLKSYIKTVCCYPSKVTQADYDAVMREFKHSEKVHVNLLIMEAKIQAELLYGLRTIMRFIL